MSTQRRTATTLLLLAVGSRFAAAQLPGRASGGTTGTSQSQTSPQQTASNSTANLIDVSGRVLNGRTNQPIPRAMVQFGSRRVLTDHDGLFHFPGVTVSTASFRASKPGFFPGSDDSPHMYTLPSDKAIELTLYPEAILSGTVVDSTGEPAPRLSVSVRASVYNDTGHHWPQVGHTQTLSDGTFRLSLAAGVYALQVTAIGRAVPGIDFLQSVSVPANPASIAEAIRLAPGDQVHLDLRPILRRTYDVALRIDRNADPGQAQGTDPDRGRDRGFPMLTARPLSGPVMSLAAIPNRDDPGSFHVALPNGTYEIIADMMNQDSRRQGRASVTVADHAVSGVQLTMAPTPIFPVVIEVDNSAASDHTTTIPTAQQLGISLNSEPNSFNLNDQSFSISSRGTAPPSVSLPEGSYRLHARPGGSWYVTAASCGGTDLLQQSLSIAPGAAGAEMRVRISNRTADLTGSVQLDGTASSAWVYLIATVPSASPFLSFRSGTTGTFSSPYLAPGTYRAVALEHQLSADLQNPEVLNRYLSRVQTITINPGDHATLALNAVPASELIP